MEQADSISSEVPELLRIYVKENTGYSLSIRGKTQVILSPNNDADISQFWVKYYKPHKDAFVLVNRFSGQALKQPSAADQRMQLDTYDDDDDDDQLLWKEHDIHDSKYKNIVSEDNENLVLEASSEGRTTNGIANGNPIVLGEYNHTDRNQMWKLVPTDITFGGVFVNVGLNF